VAQEAATRAVLPLSGLAQQLILASLSSLFSALVTLAVVYFSFISKAVTADELDSRLASGFAAQETRQSERLSERSSDIAEIKDELKKQGEQINQLRVDVGALLLSRRGS